MDFAQNTFNVNSVGVLALLRFPKKNDIHKGVEIFFYYFEISIFFVPLLYYFEPPLYYFEIFILVTDTKNFLKAPSAPIYTYFKGARAKKTQFFWSKFSKKCLKTPLLACFSKFCPNQCLFSTLGEPGKSIWSIDLKKKKVYKIFENF